MVISVHPEFLQTLESFTAPDPWTGQNDVLFCIEDYVMVAAWDPSAPLPPDSLRAKMMDHRLAIRPVAGSKPQFLPESLISLWRAGQVPIQELPRLLAGLQPQLQKSSDYYESSSTWIRRWGNRLGGGLALAGLLYWLGQMVWSQDYADLGHWAGVAMIPLLFCGTVELVYLRQVRRRAAQKTWALEQIVAHSMSTKTM